MEQWQEGGKPSEGPQRALRGFIKEKILSLSSKCQARALTKRLEYVNVDMLLCIQVAGLLTGKAVASQMV